MKEDDNTNLSEHNIKDEPQIKTILDRYVIISPYCQYKNVLDVACGYGHGTILLKILGATSVTGVDLDKKAIDIIREQYEIENVIFVCRDLFLFEEENLYDTVVSIETFEHVPREKITSMLNIFKKICKPNGIIIISTPRRYSEQFIYKGGTHLYEYTIQEFHDEISNIFSNFEIFFCHELIWKNSQEINTYTSKNINDFANVQMAIIQNIK